MPICKGILLGFRHIIPVNPREHCRAGCVLGTALQLMLQLAALNSYRRDHGLQLTSPTLLISYKLRICFVKIAI